MPDSLVSRLESAIAAKAEKARRATMGPWWTPPIGDIAEWAVYGAVSADHTEGWTVANTVQHPRELRWSEATKLRPHPSVVEHANANAEHIADNDPSVVLRMCDAHQQIIERYKRSLAVSPALASFTRGQDDGYRQACLDALRDVASGYGLTETEEN